MIIFGTGINAVCGRTRWINGTKFIEKQGRPETPSYGIIDSHSVKTQYPSHDRGFDGNKKVTGRKRHGVVDIGGNLVTMVVHSATHSDTVAGCQVLAKASHKYKTIKAVSGEQGYQGTAVEFVKKEWGLSLTISVKKAGGFTVLPKRWMVEMAQPYCCYTGTALQFDLAW